MMLTPRMSRCSPSPPARTAASSRHGSRSASATEIAATALPGSVAASLIARPTLGRRRLVALDVGDLASQLADLVAQPRRVLEAQVLGGGEHLLLELDDRLLDLGERHVLRLRALALA